MITKEKFNDNFKVAYSSIDGSVEYYYCRVESYAEFDKFFTEEYIKDCVEIYYELEEQIREAYYNVHKRYFDQIGITVKYDNFASFGGTWAGYYAYLTLDEIERLKELPFGIRLHLLPKFAEEHLADITA